MKYTLMITYKNEFGYETTFLVNNLKTRKDVEDRIHHNRVNIDYLGYTLVSFKTFRVENNELKIVDVLSSIN